MRPITSPAAGTLEPGYRVDRYELLAKIGQGGMASVWLARTPDEKAGFFAIKTILPEHVGDDVLRKMMLDEAGIAMGIHHPNVARMLEAGQLWDMPYLVLEYVDGESLDQLCKVLSASEAHVPAPIAVRLVVDTCAGLHAAHELVAANGTPLEIVHRDLSTHNILVDGTGRVKLIDFGIAKANERLTKTASGLTKGKIPYMSPEQALGGIVDRRSDLWSLGAVLYVLLSGTAPFDGAHDTERLMGKLSGDPPEPLPETVPEALRDVVARTLAFRREDRYATAAELGAALEAAVPKATEAEVASFFEEHLASAMKKRRQVVEQALAAAAQRAIARELLRSGGAPSSRRTRPARRPRPTTPDGRSATASDADGTFETRRWTTYVSAAAIVLVVLAAYVLGTASGRRVAGLPPTPTAEPNATTSATAATPSIVASSSRAAPLATTTSLVSPRPSTSASTSSVADASADARPAASDETIF